MPITVQTNDEVATNKRKQDCERSSNKISPPPTKLRDEPLKREAEFDKDGRNSLELSVTHRNEGNKSSREDGETEVSSRRQSPSCHRFVLLALLSTSISDNFVLALHSREKVKRRKLKQGKQEDWKR